MKAQNVFVEFDEDEKNTSPEIFELNIVSGGCRLYGYLLTPDRRIDKPYPTVILSHGFPGYTTNNDLELALMRAGCVVIHMNHRGAWGSEGNYLQRSCCPTSAYCRGRIVAHRRVWSSWTPKARIAIRR